MSLTNNQHQRIYWPCPMCC